MPLELIVGAAVGVAAASPRVRKAVRRGLIYGLGNALIAYDKVAGLAHGAVEGARKGVATATDGAPQPTPGAAPPAATAPQPTAGIVPAAGQITAERPSVAPST
ncbi:MAG TPA: hypothetical protein VKA46_16595 [Gemmataceae bacterium]|nr:hypothetical protein [Gemmataceae bacterium]